MPKTEVVFFQEANGNSPIVNWLEGLRSMDEKAYAKCVAMVERLAELGHELRRPTTDMLRNGIYELRARKGRVNYRLLYFFYGKNVAILSHGLTKLDRVPLVEIERALRCRKAFEANPEQHTYAE